MRGFGQIILHPLYQMKSAIGLAALCMLGFTLVELLMPWPIKIIVEYILLDKPVPDYLSFLNGLLQSDSLMALIVVSSSIFVIAILAAGFAFSQQYLTAKIGFRVTYALRRELFSRLQELSLSFHTKARSGELLTKVSGDTSALKDFFGEWGLTVVTQMLVFSGMLVIMFTLNWQLSLIVLATLPALFIVLIRLNRKLKVTATKFRKQEGRIATRINEVLTSIALVQAFGREGFENDRFEMESARNVEVGIQSARTSAAVSETVALVSAMGTAGTVLFGSWQVLQGRMTPGDLLIFVSYVGSLYKPVRQLARLSAKFSRAVVSAQRIAEILDIEPEIRDHPQAIRAPNLQGQIAFEDVSFGYQDGHKVLDRVSFRIDPGQRVGLVGTSGAGKSTIVSLLLRLYDPQEGRISVDGVPISHYQRESLRGQVGIVLQEALLFGASIAENIAYGKSEATSDEIEQAARQAHAHDFIMELQDGYGAVVGERGCTLSGGQRQRICLARAIIKHPSVLVLDEPTSAVDPLSAGLINEAVARIQAGKTMLVIAHQFHAMREFDQILVLKNGHIVENGSHAQLLNCKGHYYELYHRDSGEQLAGVTAPGLAADV